jgi:hypothetical protein
MARKQRQKMGAFPPDTPSIARNMRIEAIEIPKKYEDPNQSGLTYEVTSGLQVYDLDLK